MRHIDRLVIAVPDLDAAGAAYTNLGFQVGARNRHPCGTENRINQFPRAFTAPGQFSFGAFVRTQSTGWRQSKKSLPSPISHQCRSR